MSDLLDGAFVSGFDSPLEMLLACHGKIQTQCATLHKLLLHLPSHGCDTQARQAAQAILRYFDTAGQNHHDDEEQDLFPPLLATPNTEVHELIARLLDEHKVLDAAWQQLRPLLLAIAEDRSQYCWIISNWKHLVKAWQHGAGLCFPIHASHLQVARHVELA